MNLLNIVKPTDMLTAADWQITPGAQDVFVLSRPGISYKMPYSALLSDVTAQLNPSDLGLANIDNTADLDKPISDAVREAMLYKADLVAGKIPVSQLPMMLDDVVEYDNLVVFPRPGEEGKIYVARDTELVYRWAATVYVELSSRLAVGELAGQAFDGASGKAVRLHSEDVLTNPHEVTADQVGLGDVDNTTDADKPVSDATQDALDLKADKSVYELFIARTDNPHDVTQNQVGLGDVDNTADIAKPVSIPQLHALNAKTPLATTSAHISNKDNPHEVNAEDLGLENVDNTSDLDKPVSTLQASAIAASTGGASTHAGLTDNPHGVTKAQIGLTDVDDTSDADKPISDDTQTALTAEKDAREDHEALANNPHSVTKAQVGLTDVDDTSDADKPVSTLQAQAIGAVEGNVNTHKGRTDNPHGVTATQLTLGNVDNTTDANKPISDDTQDALDDKENAANKHNVVRSSANASSDKFPTELAVATAIEAFEAMVTYPSEVDFPVTGVSGIIYLDNSTSALFRWKGSSYGEMSSGGLKLRGAVADAGAGIYIVDASGGATFTLPLATGSFGRRLISIHGYTGDSVTLISVDGTNSKVNGQASISINENCVIEVIDSATNKWSVTEPTNAALSTFKARTDNPHSVTQDQVGLGDVDNTTDANKPISTLTQSALDALDGIADTHIGRSDNPHSVTAADVGLEDVDNTTDANKPISNAQVTVNSGLQDDIDDHIADTNNPHAVTAAQLTLGNVDNTSDANKPLSNASVNALGFKQNKNDRVNTIRVVTAATDDKYPSEKAVSTLVGDHVNDLDNPHDVTKSDVMLGNVDNTSDALKPVSTATQTAINVVGTASGNHALNTNNPHQVTKGQVNLGSVDDTADADKPISDATATKFTAVDLVASNHIGDTTNPHAVTADQVGLGDVDNTADADKPISDDVVTALATRDTNLNTHKADTSNPHQVTKSQLTLGNVDNTTDADKPVSTAQQNALDLKQSISARVSTIDVSGSASNTKYPTERAVWSALEDLADMVFVGTFNSFPSSGDIRSLYIAEDTNYLFRWDASASGYKEITDSGIRYRGALNMSQANIEDGLYRCSGIGSSSFTLPPATGGGRRVKVAMYEFTGASTLTVQPSGTDKINGVAANSVHEQDGFVEFIDILSGKWVTGINIDSSISLHHLDTTNPHEVTAAQVGLGAVDNTADINKPISGDQQTALNARQLKANITLNVPASTSSSDTAYPSQKAVAKAVELRQVLTERTNLVRDIVNADNNHYPTEKAVANAVATKLDATAMTNHTSDYTNPHSVTATHVGLGNVDNTSDAAKPVSTAQGLVFDLKADLVGGKVPASQLPAFVDDVLEFADYTALELNAGETGKIYVTLDNNKTYRWGSSTYVEISTSLSVGNTAGTAFDAALGHTNIIAIQNRELLANKTTFVRDIANATHTKYPTELAVANLLDAGFHINPYVDKTDFPLVGEEGEIYLDKTTNLIWSWNQLSAVYREASYNGLKYYGESADVGAGSYSFDCLSTNAFQLPEATGSGDRYQLNLFNYNGDGVSITTTPSAATINGDATTLLLSEDTVVTFVDVGIEMWVAQLPATASLHPTTTNNPHGVTKAQVGLGDVNNTSDLAKPVSTAQGLINSAKADVTDLTSHTGNTSNPHSVTAAQVGLDDVNNTTDMAKPVSTLQGLAIDAKQSKSDLVLAIRDIANAEDSKYPSEKAVRAALNDLLGHFHIQSTAALIWNVTHNLKYFPALTITDDAGYERVGIVQHTSIDTVQITFTSAISGKVTCK